MKEHAIAVIPGDGIGREVIPEGVRVLEAAGAKRGMRFKWQEFPWSCDWYKAHGRMCPEDAPEILRPVRLFEGLPCPLAGRKPGDIDYVVIRENTEGEYGNVGGRIFEGTEHEAAMQQAIFTRKGTDRIMKYAFELARTRKKHLTSCTKSNGISITMPYWDERFAAMA